MKSSKMKEKSLPERGRDGETCKRYYMDPKNYGINYKTGRPSSLLKNQNHEKTTYEFGIIFCM